MTEILAYKKIVVLKKFQKHQDTSIRTCKSHQRKYGIIQEDYDKHPEKTSCFRSRINKFNGRMESVLTEITRGSNNSKEKIHHEKDIW